MSRKLLRDLLRLQIPCHNITIVSTARESGGAHVCVHHVDEIVSSRRNADELHRIAAAADEKAIVTCSALLSYFVVLVS